MSMASQGFFIIIDIYAKEQNSKRGNFSQSKRENQKVQVYGIRGF